MLELGTCETYVAIAVGSSSCVSRGCTLAVAMLYPIELNFGCVTQLSNCVFTNKTELSVKKTSHSRQVPSGRIASWQIFSTFAEDLSHSWQDLNVFDVLIVIVVARAAMGQLAWLIHQQLECWLRAILALLLLVFDVFDVFAKAQAQAHFAVIFKRSASEVVLLCQCNHEFCSSAQIVIDLCGAIHL